MVERVLDARINLPRGHFGAILVDPPTKFKTWSEKGMGRSPDRHYKTITFAEIRAMPVGSLAARDCVLFLWATWPNLLEYLAIIAAWGFVYKTDGFIYIKTNRDGSPFIGNGYWTRANTEPCLLATRGHPKRKHADVSQVIIAPRREHSRKPDCIYERIERLVAGPYLEIFARTSRRAWTAWGDEVGKFPEAAE